MKKIYFLAPFVLAACGQGADSLYAENLAVQSLDPANGPSEGGTRVALRGYAFCDDLKISFGGVPATKVELVSRTFALADTPPHPIGRVDVELACPSAGQLVLGGKFGYGASRVRLATEIALPDLGDRAMIFEDVDGDGLEELIDGPDIRGDRSIAEIYQNLGYAGFSARPTLTLDFSAISQMNPWMRFQARDVDGDLRADFLATATYNLDTASGPRVFGGVLYYSSQDDHATPRRWDVPAGFAHFELVWAGDLDGDLDLDFIAHEWDGGESATLVFCAGDGQGGYTKNTLGETGIFTPESVVRWRVDFNLDGIEDAVLRDVFDAGSFVTGASSGLPQAITATVPGASMPTFAYVDDDPLLDIIDGAVSFAENNIYLATGPGTYGPAQQLPVRCSGRCPEITEIVPLPLDLDADGRHEVLMKYVHGDQRGGSPGLALMRGDGVLVQLAGTSQKVWGAAHVAPGERAIIYGSPARVALLPEESGSLYYRPRLETRVHTFCSAELDGDGLDDLVSVDLVDASVRMASGAMLGGMSPSTIIGAPHPSGWFGLSEAECETGDVDGDGRIDVLVEDGISPRGRILRNRGDGSFDDLPIIEDQMPKAALHLRLDDLDGDGKSEVLVPILDVDRSTTTIEVRAWNGAGFSVTQHGAPLEGEGVGTLGDFDGDGVLDYLGSAETTILIRFGETGTGGELTFTASIALAATLDQPLRLIDLDADGKDELLRFSGGPSQPLARGLSEVRIDLPSTFGYAGSCDLDGDGQKDLLVAGDSVLGWLIQKRPRELGLLGVFETAGTSFAAVGMHCADIDRDGRDDVLYMDSNTRAVHALMNRSE